jgi:nicotinamide mononucleotide transporter
MDFMQIFTLVTGVIYIILEIRQKNSMWYVGILTSIAAMWVFFRQDLYASFGLNTYYLITSIIGLWQWKRDKDIISTDKTDESGNKDIIHLNRLNWKTVAASALITIAGTVLLAEIMLKLENPMSYIDSAVTVLSAVATWWLVKAYLQQWWLWIAADLMSTILCVTQGLWWMSLLYALYTLSAFYGLYHWKRNGEYI